MSDVILRVEGLGKRYRIGKRQQRHVTLRDAIVGRVNRLKVEGLQATGPNLRPSNLQPLTSADTEFWALRDVSFEVKQGEVLGIIGRNGAGKSTLLKILSRITDPTEGGADIDGRVGSLLEVGTGFHPELTGRENVYLNGAILGMKRAEIARRFDEIVAFAEIDKFLDTPVKRFSSGMYVRLAFAVAAHLEPEILLVDEVLAVGDLEFQKKCLGKMGSVAREGRTVLFVSHNMPAISSLCSRAIWIDNGHLKTDGEAKTMISQYIQASNIFRTPQEIASSRHFCLSEVTIEGPNLKHPESLRPFSVTVRGTARADLTDIGAHIYIEDEGGLVLLGLDSRDFQAGVRALEDDHFTIVFRIEELPIAPGLFNLHLWLKSQSDVVYEDVGYIPFEIAQSDIYGARQVERRWHGFAVTRASVEVST